MALHEGFPCVFFFFFRTLITKHVQECANCAPNHLNYNIQALILNSICNHGLHENRNLQYCDADCFISTRSQQERSNKYTNNLSSPACCALLISKHRAYVDVLRPYHTPQLRRCIPEKPVSTQLFASRKSLAVNPCQLHFSLETNMCAKACMHR